jgi:hypothetical protein
MCVRLSCHHIAFFILFTLSCCVIVDFTINLVIVDGGGVVLAVVIFVLHHSPFCPLLVPLVIVNVSLLIPFVS